MTFRTAFGVSVLIATPMLLTTSCIDNGYDLSDIDTTTEIKVKDLVLPVNMDPVVLSDIITLEDDGKVKLVTINGKTFYAVEETGSFNSDPVKINEFSANPGEINPSTASFDLIGATGRSRLTRAGNVLNFCLASPVNNRLKYQATGIDKAIHSLKSIGCRDLSLTINLSLQQSNVFNSVTLKDVVLQLPKGLSVKSVTPSQSGSYGYNITTGELKLEKVQIQDGKATIGIVATGVDLSANGATLDYPNHILNIDAPFNLVAGQLTADINTGAISSVTTVNFDINYAISQLYATEVTGQISYNLDGQGLNINPIELNDLPEFLADEKTNLILHNPQIYLNINNPVGDADLSYHSGIEIISHFENGSSNVVKLDEFNVGHENGVGPYNYCLSPLMPEDVPSEYAAGLKHVVYAGLGEVLSGAGLPRTLDLKLLNPEIYLQDAKNFKLGRELAAMKGTYRFLAPLALSGTADSGSVIVYTDHVDGWNNEDVEALTIETLEVGANITSTIPLAAHLNAHPIDINGNVINGVEVEGADIPGGATDYPMTIRITGTVKNLDGVVFEAIVRSDGTGATLAPEQSLTLKQIRAKVSGNYTKEF